MTARAYLKSQNFKKTKYQDTYSYTDNDIKITVFYRKSGTKTSLIEVELKDKVFQYSSPSDDYLIKDIKSLLAKNLYKITFTVVTHEMLSEYWKYKDIKELFKVKDLAFEFTKTEEKV